LANVSDLDDALIRPGRCFAHVDVRKLQSEEVKPLLSQLCSDNGASDTTTGCFNFW